MAMALPPYTRAGHSKSDSPEAPAPEACPDAETPLRASGAAEAARDGSPAAKMRKSESVSQVHLIRTYDAVCGHTSTPFANFAHP